MKYDVYYNVMGVLPVHNHFAIKESADAFAERAKSMGFDAEVIEL